VTRRFDAYQRSHPAAGFPIAVLYKYLDDGAGSLAALLTYYGFVSMFPLLLLASTILGLVLSGDPGAQKAVLDSALSQFPVIGGQLHQPDRLGGGVAGLTVGVLGALYGGLGVTLALQNAMNTAWTVPRNLRPNPLQSRARGLVLLLTSGSALLSTGVLGALGGGGVGSFGVLVRVAAMLASVLISAVTFIVLFRVATARHLSVRDVAPGAIAAAIAWQLLQFFGASYVNGVVKHSSDTNGVFALVLGLIAFIYLAAVAIMFCVEVNVVRVDRLYPRALLGPLTDNVHLTEGDQRAYTDQAKAQQYKGSEHIEVRFDG
jgi:YihY family inner membrane protein